MWISAIGVLAVIAACEIAILFARKNGRFFAKLYLLEDWDKLNPERSNTHD